MLPSTPASNVNSPGRTAETQLHDRLHLGSSTSPKAQELRARYEALHAAANQNANANANANLKVSHS